MSPVDPRIQPVLDEFVRLLRAEYGRDLVSVVLYGSVARGKATNDSDVDLLVVCRKLPQDLWQRYDRLRPIEQRLEPDLQAIQAKTGWYPYLSIQIRSTEEAERTSRTYFDMVEEAILLVDEGGFFTKVLDRIAARMKTLGSRRVWIGDKWYWDLKPDLVWGEVFEI